MSHLPPLLALAATLAPQPASTPDDLATLEMNPVELTRADGSTVTAERGTLSVPIVRADPDSKRISVDVWLFPADEGASPDTPPIFRLHGGPGWPGMEPNQVDYEDDVAPYVRNADLVVVGQRGIGTSKPNTVCGLVPNPTKGEKPTRDQRAEAIVKGCTNCREYWEDRGYDIKGFNVIEAAADVNDIRRLLGYETITVWGGSFGSHWGMTVMRYHPNIVARAVLTGMEGPDHTYDMPSGVLAALERMAAEAEQSSQLADHIPDGGLIAAFKRVIADLSAEPLEFELDHLRSGEPEVVLIEADDIRGAALGYSGRTSSRRGARTWAADVIALHNGNFEGIARRVMGDRVQGLPTASFFMLDCGSGISPKRLETLQNDPAAQVVGDLGWWYQTACSAWDSDLGEDFRANFTTDIPTAIVHGTWDTSTPFDNALELVPSFKNGHFVIVEGGSHGALGEAMRHSQDFMAALTAFVVSGDGSTLPKTVKLPELDWAPPHP